VPIRYHVSGEFRIDLTEGSFTLQRQGDYLVWGPGIDHSLEAVTDAVVVTVRWPSSVVTDGEFDDLA
jgi:quercetin dioxygenase-like cupin family protein